MKSLKDFQWAIDYSNAVGQKDAVIPPQIFLSRSHARKANAKFFPKGRICKIVIKEKK